MTPRLDLGAVAPLLIVAFGALLVPLAEVVLARKRTLLGATLSAVSRSWYLAASSGLIVVVALVVVANGASGPVRVFNADHPMFARDGWSSFLAAVVLISGLLTVLVSSKYLADVRANHGEYYALLLASLAGMLLLVSATDLVLLFVALELSTIPVYALVGLRRDSMQSGESALKYFVMGSFASAVLLYGSALLYGATGSLSLDGIGAGLDPENTLDVVGTGLLIVGLTFKVASVPFHQWVPDTYQGAPTTISGFMATAIKTAAFGALLRVLSAALHPASDLIYPVLWALAALSMTVGNVMALSQRNVKRMLAWSSVAHAGYLLVGVLVGGVAGRAAVAFYLLAYAFMALGPFAVICVMARDGRERDRVDDLAGLLQTRPFLAVAMAVCLFSLLGMPGTAGFIGKFQIFGSAVSHGVATADGWLIALVVIAVLNTAISAAYYLRVVSVMFMRPAPADAQAPVPGTFELLVLFACILGCVVPGIAPQNVFPLVEDVDLLRMAQWAAASIGP